MKKLESFPKEIDGFVTLFEFYLDALNETIVNDLQIRTEKNIVFDFIHDFLEILFPDNIYKGLDENIVRGIAGKYSDTLFDALIDEGLLSFDIYRNYDNKTQHEIVRFTFERYGEHITARNIINNCITIKDVKQLFKRRKTIRKLLPTYKPERSQVITKILSFFSKMFNGWKRKKLTSVNNIYKNAGLITALSLLVGQRNFLRISIPIMHMIDWDTAVNV